MSPADVSFMQMACAQAELAIGLSSPNPRVGCVLVVQGVVVAMGHTQAAGQAHAEVMAIRAAQSANIALQGCTVYVTLEPCAHFGRTPPCVDALMAIAPARVVVACVDANPLVAGQGIAALRSAGIEVDVLVQSHPLAQQAFDLNIGFMRRMAQNRVYTRLKWASTMDGKTALPDGRSQWITGGLARDDGQHFRARADVIVSGIGTVLHDNPQLNVRVKQLAQQPLKCIVDTWLRTPLDARLFAEDAAVVLVCADVDDALQRDKIDCIIQTHPRASVLPLPLAGQHIDLNALWAWFYKMHINEVHVEAGAQLNAALLSAGLVDELLMYVAPRIMGAGLTAACFQEQILDELHESARWRWLDAQLVGDDIRLRAQKKES